MEPADRPSGFIFWPLCYSLIIAVICRSDQQIISDDVKKNNDLLATCPDNYTHGVKTRIRCTLLTYPRLRFFTEKCTEESRGLFVYNGSETMGTSNCDMVKKVGLGWCFRKNFTRNGNVFPQCSCEEDRDLITYQVEFYPDKVYDQGRTFRCTFHCVKPQGGTPNFILLENGRCNKITVDCNRTTYGARCNSTCGHCAGGRRCNQDTGTCPQCQPGYLPPLCQRCVNDGLLPGNCTVCTSPVLRPSDCQHCTSPGFKPPICAECLPGLEPPNCTDTGNGVSPAGSTPTENGKALSSVKGSALSPAQLVVVLGSSVLGLVSLLVVFVVVLRILSKPAVRGSHLTSPYVQAVPTAAIRDGSKASAGSKETSSVLEVTEVSEATDVSETTDASGMTSDSEAVSISKV